MKQTEIMNKSFQKVFTVENDLIEKETIFRGLVFKDIEDGLLEIKNLLRKQYVGKTPCSDDVSNWIQ